MIFLHHAKCKMKSPLLETALDGFERLVLARRTAGDVRCGDWLHVGAASKHILASLDRGH